MRQSNSKSVSSSLSLTILQAEALDTAEEAEEEGITAWKGNPTTTTCSTKGEWRNYVNKRPWYNEWQAYTTSYYYTSYPLSLLLDTYDTYGYNNYKTTTQELYLVV